MNPGDDLGDDHFQPVAEVTEISYSLAMAARIKYQIFISSTFEDLKDERQDLVMACLEMGHIPIGMEMFSAANDDQWNVIKRTIDQCDYYVVLVAARHGSTIEAEDGISYTEKEYDYAVQQHVPVLGFVLSSKAPWPGDRRESDVVKTARLEHFKSKIQSKMVSSWSSRDELRGKFAIAIGKAFEEHQRPGWIPASEAASPQVSSELARLSQENDELRRRLAAIASLEDADLQLDRVIEMLSKIPATTQAAGTTVWDVFRRYGGGFQISGLVASIVNDQPESVMNGIVEDLWVLEAHELLFANSDRNERMPFYANFSLTELGRDLLRREDRARVETRRRASEE